MARTNVLNRLQLWQKLGLIGITFLVPLGVITYFLIEEKQIKIDFARAEMNGDEYLRPCARLLDSAVRHRSLARRALRGDPVDVELGDAERTAELALSDLAGVQDKLGVALEVNPTELSLRPSGKSAHPGEIAASWALLKVRAPDIATSDSQHDAFIANVATLIAHVGDTSKLILDPDLDTYYTMDALLLQAPELVRLVSQLGDEVDDLLTRGVLTPPERAAVATRIAFLQFRSDNIQADAKLAINNAPRFSNWAPVAKTLNEPMFNVASSSSALIAAIARDVLEPAQPTLTRAALHAGVTRVLDNTRNYWSILLDAEDTMLELRQDGDLVRRRVAFSAMLASVALAALVTMLILRSITGPVKRAIKVAQQLASGELPETIELDRATDETGRLLRAINDMLKFLDLKRLISTLQDSGDQLVTTFCQLEDDSTAQAEAAVQQAAALHETQVTAQQIKQTSRMASEKATSVLDLVQRAEEVGKAGEDAIESTVGGLNDIRQQADEIAIKIAELNDRTMQVGVITQTVKDLADQSNMLALNAAIEAVRSGEHGRGFAVVAREIRSLADQSIQATARVAEILETVSASIRQVVSLANVGRSRTESNIAQVRSSGERLRELSSLARDTSQSVRIIAGAVSQQDAGIAQVFAAISQQSQLMEETVKRSEASKLAVQSARDVAAQVASVASRFKR